MSAYINDEDNFNNMVNDSADSSLLNSDVESDYSDEIGGGSLSHQQQEERRLNNSPPLQEVGDNEEGYEHKGQEEGEVDDNSSGGDGCDGCGDDFIPGTFEGPEKNLCVEFKPGMGHVNGCRELDRNSLDAICAAAKCSILSSISNDYVDAYVLSESSLFVFKNKIILKTCGTTTLLRCLMPLLKFTDNLGLEIDWIGYSRKNFSFPDSQIFPHCSFHEEFDYLKRHPQLEQRVSGEGYILGPITKDHFMAYVSDRSSSSSSNATLQIGGSCAEVIHQPLSFVSEDVTINIMMFELDEQITPMFYKKNTATAKEMTLLSGISKLSPGFIIDDHAFEPCGYSMNATLNDNYSTIHITPEKECSYASFETNLKMSCYHDLIVNVVNVFKPGRIVITILADDKGLKNVTDLPFDHDKIINKEAQMTYKRSCFSSTKVAGESCVLMGVWELVN